MMMNTATNRAFKTVKIQKKKDKGPGVHPQPCPVTRILPLLRASQRSCEVCHQDFSQPQDNVPCELSQDLR